MWKLLTTIEDHSSGTCRFSLIVDNELLLVFTLKFIRGVGDPGIFVLATGLETEFLLFVEVFIDAALALNCNFFLFLLLT